MPEAARPIFLSAEWRYLAMLNYRIDRAILEPLVPFGTELDLFEGHAYVSIIAFLFLKTKVLGIAIPFHQDFEEVNLRFYVRRIEKGENRRGAVFIQELVPRPAIAAVARLFYNENYFSTNISHHLHHEMKQVSLGFKWRFARLNHSLTLQAQGDPSPMQDGSEQQFIADHYWGYARQRNGDTVEYQVKHPSWRIWPVTDYTLDANVHALYGERFAATLQQPPASVFLAEGSPVTVSKGRRIRKDKA